MSPYARLADQSLVPWSDAVHFHAIIVQTSRTRVWAHHFDNAIYGGTPVIRTIKAGIGQPEPGMTTYTIEPL